MVTTRKYTSILGLSLRHDYYFDKDQDNLKPGLCTDFNISPSRETAKKLVDLGIKLKAESTGFELYAPDERLDLIAGFTDPLYIELKFNNQQLTYYTHLGGVEFTDNFKRNKVLFFSNRTVDRFATQPNVYASSDDMAERAMGFLSLPVNLQRKNIKKAIFVLQKEVTESLELIFQEPVNGEAIPLSELPFGIYKSVQYFDKDDAELANISFPDKGLLINNSPNLVGVIEIYLDQIGKKEHAIHFEKKQAFWNYIIVTKSVVNVDLKYSTPSDVKTELVYGADDIKFEEFLFSDLETPFQAFVNQLESAFLDSSKKFTFFRSEEELPISEVLNMGLSLVKSGGLEVIEDALTNPNSSNVLKIQQNAQPHHLYALIDVSNLDSS